MIVFLFQLAVNLIEFWILLLLMQYICAAHISLSRRNVVISSIIHISLDALYIMLLQ